ncbi:MAG: hypothetical protein ACAI34_24770 [Verrucomicrobium sp.]|nr:hypothetical protein [Verrucomicrobium sp.]
MHPTNSNLEWRARKTELFFGGLILFGIAMVGSSWWYGSRTAPKVDAARVIALDKGREFLKTLPLPTGSTVFSPLEERLSTYSRGPLRGTKSHVTWYVEYDAPGTFEEGLRHFEATLLHQGWQRRAVRVPSVLQQEWERPPFILSIGDRGFWQHPVSHRFSLMLQWDWNFE